MDDDEQTQSSSRKTGGRKKTRSRTTSSFANASRYAPPAYENVHAYPTHSSDNTQGMLSSDAARLIGLSTRILESPPSVTSKVPSHFDYLSARSQRESEGRGPGTYIGARGSPGGSGNAVALARAREKNSLTASFRNAHAYVPSPSAAVHTYASSPNQKDANPPFVWKGVNSAYSQLDPTDHAHKMTLATSMSESALAYSPQFTSPVPRFTPSGAATSPNAIVPKDAAAAMGPGSFDLTRDGLGMSIADPERQHAQFVSVATRSNHTYAQQPSSAATSRQARNELHALKPAHGGGAAGSGEPGGVFVRPLVADARNEAMRRKNPKLKKGPVMVQMIGQLAIAQYGGGVGGFEHALSTATAQADAAAKHQRGRAGLPDGSKPTSSSASVPFGSTKPRFSRPRSALDSWELDAATQKLKLIAGSGYVGPGSYEATPTEARIHVVNPSKASPSFSAQPRPELFPPAADSPDPCEPVRWPQGPRDGSQSGFHFRTTTFYE